MNINVLSDQELLSNTKKLVKGRKEFNLKSYRTSRRD